MYKKLLTIVFSFFIFASLVSPALADQTLLKGNNCLYEDSVVTMNCIGPLFANAVYWLLIMSGVVAVFLIAYGGLKFLTSSGEAKAVDSAKKTITWAIIGLIVILLSFGIVTIISEITGVRCITNFGFTACGNASNSSIDDPICKAVGESCTNASQCCGSAVCSYESSFSGGRCASVNSCISDINPATCSTNTNCCSGYHCSIPSSFEPGACVPD